MASDHENPNELSPFLLPQLELKIPISKARNPPLNAIDSIWKDAGVILR